MNYTLKSVILSSWLLGAILFPSLLRGSKNFWKQNCSELIFKYLMHYIISCFELFFFPQIFMKN